MWIKYLCDQIGFEEICNKKNNVTKYKNVFYVTCIGINFLIKL